MQLCGFSEIVAEGTLRNFEEQLKANYRPRQVHQFWAPGRQIRRIADSCNVLLSSSHPRRTAHSTQILTDNPQLDRLIELAIKYSDVKETFDLYTYGRYQAAECDASSIRFVDTDHKRDAISGVGAERTASSDYASAIVIRMAARQLRECLGQPLDDEGFEDYLLRHESCIPLMVRLADTVAHDLDFEIDIYFDTETVVDKHSHLTVTDITKCWAVLRSIATVATQWQHKRSWEIVHREAVASLRRSVIVSAIKEYLGCGSMKARALVRRFQVKGDKSPVDLFFKPLLISESGSEVILCSRFIETGRFERNIFSILVADGVQDQDEKGFRPIEELVKAFQGAGFIAAGDVRIYVNGKLVTDADVVAFKDGELFLGQAKVVIEPDTIYEVWKAENRLKHAAAQLRECETNQSRIVEELRKLNPGAAIEVVHATPFILTNTRQFTEMEIDGYPVVDLPYVEFILGGATGTVILAHRDIAELSDGESFISGEYPSGAELRILLRDTIHAVKKRYKGKRIEELIIDTFRVIFPTTLLHPSPHPFMSVAGEQEREGPSPTDVLPSSPTNPGTGEAIPLL